MNTPQDDVSNDSNADSRHNPSDDVGTASGDSAAPTVEDNLKSKSTWMRLVFILLFGIIYGITRALVTVLIIVQFFWALITGAPNDKLSLLGHAFALYTAEIIDYMSFYVDERPFPFDKDWPAVD